MRRDLEDEDRSQEEPVKARHREGRVSVLGAGLEQQSSKASSQRDPPLADVVGIFPDRTSGTRLRLSPRLPWSHDDHQRQTASPTGAWVLASPTSHSGLAHAVNV